MGAEREYNSETASLWKEKLKKNIGAYERKSNMGVEREYNSETASLWKEKLKKNIGAYERKSNMED